MMFIRSTMITVCVQSENSVGKGLYWQLVGSSPSGHQSNTAVATTPTVAHSRSHPQWQSTSATTVSRAEATSGTVHICIDLLHHLIIMIWWRRKMSKDDEMKITTSQKYTFHVYLSIEDFNVFGCVFLLNICIYVLGWAYCNIIVLFMCIEDYNVFALY